MHAESNRRRVRPQKYTFVMLPASEEGTPKRITLSRLGILAIGAGILALSTVFVLGLLVFTPVGVYIPIPNPELENKYHRKVVGIQNRLTQLTEDLVFLRDYNLRLRKALGDRMSPEDSAFMSAQLIAQQREFSISRNNRQQTMNQAKQPLSAPANAGVPPRPGPAQPAAFIIKAVGKQLPMILPVRGYVTQEFDPDRQHFGMDFAAKEGTSIFASADGRVVFAGWTYDDGHMVILAHGGGYSTTYKHNRALLKAQGDVVRRGESIALLGNSGKTSYGPHLHFEMWKDGVPQNPRDFLLTVQ